MDVFLSDVSQFIGANTWLALIAAFVGGALTSFTPCSLSGASLAVAYVGGVERKGTLASFKLSLVFAVGSAAAFTVIGLVATAAGALIGSGGSWFYIVLGVLMVAMSLQIWGFVEVIPSTYLSSKSMRRGYAGAFAAGLLGGVFSSPCSTPVLIALLAAVASSGSLAWSAAMLLAYSVGHGSLAVVAGTSTGFVRSLSQSERYGKASSVLSGLMGAAVALAGVYLIYLGF